MNSKFKIDINFLFILFGLIQLIPTVRSFTFFNFIWASGYLIWLFYYFFKFFKKKINTQFLLFFTSFFLLILIPLFGSNIQISLRYFEISQIFAFSIAFTKLNSKYYKFIFVFFKLIMILTSLITLIEYQTNPFVSRLVMKNSESLSDILQFRGIGGYNFIYSLLFLTIYMIHNKINWFSSLNLKINNVIHYGILFLFITVIFKSNFATALILLSFSIVTRFMLGKKINIKKIIILNMSFLFIVFNSIFFFDVFIDLYSKFFGVDTNYNRLVEIQSFLDSGLIGISIESRLKSFVVSISIFVNNFWFGIVHSKLGVNYLGQIDSFGQHSAILDTFALYGFIIGLLFTILIFKSFNLKIKYEKYFISSSLIIQVFFIVLSFINNITPSIGFVVFAIIPIIEKSNFLKLKNIQK